ncbi:YGGT family protein, partial [Vibrio parahaemolyticus V-223/04]
SAILTLQRFCLLTCCVC